MKFLEDEKLAQFTRFLAQKELGDRVLNGRIEAFSCKKAGDDKKLSKQLEQHMKDLSAASPSGGSFGGSPNFGSLADRQVRGVVIDLICTMNACFPDYDFSGVTPDHFSKEKNVGLVINKVNAHLAEVAEVHRSNFLNEVWSAIEETIRIKECQVFSYTPDMEGDPFSDGCLWSFNYFFCNKNLKKVVYFHCTAQSKFQARSGNDHHDDSGDDDDPMDGEGGEDSGVFRNEEW